MNHKYFDPAPEPPQDSRHYQGDNEEDPDQPRMSGSFGSLFAQGLFAAAQAARRDPYHDYTPKEKQ